MKSPSLVFTGTPPDALILESPFTNIREEAKSHPFSMVRTTRQVSYQEYDLCYEKSIAHLVYLFTYVDLQISSRLRLVLFGCHNCK